MKLQELLRSHSFEDIVPHLKDIDPVQADMLAFYKEAYDELIHTEPEPADNDIGVSQQVEEDESGNKTCYLHASNCEGDLWPRCLSKEIVLGDGISVSEEFLAAKILWHMTYWGFNKEDREETFNRWHQDHVPTRQEKIDNLVERIISVRSGLSEKDLKYLYGTRTIWEYKYHTRSYDKDRRIDYLLEEVIKYGQSELLDGEQYLILVVSDSKYPLLIQDLPKIGILVEHLQQHGEVIFDFGTKDGLDEDLEALIVRSQS